MKIILFRVRLFKGRNIKASLFSSALEEAINDTFKEMGYGIEKKGKKANKQGNTYVADADNNRILKIGFE